MKNKTTIFAILLIIVALFLLAKFVVFSEKTTENNEVTTEVPTGPKATVYMTQNANGPSGQVQVDVYARNADDLSGIQMSFTYDSTYLDYNSSKEGNFLNSGGAKTFFFDMTQVKEPGVVDDIIIARQGTGVNGEGQIASLYFNVKKSGSSKINFDEVILSDMNGNKLNVATENADVNS